MELTGNVAYADIDSRESVLSRWFDAYGTDVLRLCCFYLGRYADAEDAVQENVSESLEAYGAFPGTQSVHAQNLAHEDRLQHLPGSPAPGLPKA